MSKHLTSHKLKPRGFVTVTVSRASFNLADDQAARRLDCFVVANQPLFLHFLAKFLIPSFSRSSAYRVPPFDSPLPSGSAPAQRRSLKDSANLPRPRKSSPPTLSKISKPPSGQFAELASHLKREEADPNMRL